MAKKLIALWISLAVLFLSCCVFIYADSTTVQGEYLLRDLAVNGQDVPNYKLSHPIVAYNNYIYVPLDETVDHLLGISASVDSENHTVYMTRAGQQQVNFQQEGAANNLENLTLKRVSEYRLSADGVLLDLTNRPVMMYGTTMYIPLNAIVDSGVWGWSQDWNNWIGANISTSPYYGASTYLDTAKANYKAGLVAYIRKVNPSVDVYKAQNMVDYFEDYGDIYGGFDVELLMAIAQTESTYYETVRNASGATGLMQVKTSIAASYGFSASQMYQMKPNIQMACILLNHGLNAFNGDLTLALSGYACGEGAVKRGNYSLKYYNNWVKKYFNIIAFASAYQA